MVLTIIAIAFIVVTLVDVVQLRYAIKLASKMEAETQEEKSEKRELCEYYITSIKSAQSLFEVFLLHKLVWALDLRNQNIGPCEYGMFRTTDILKMYPADVYLGNIDGLWTKSILDWEPYKDNDPETYKTVLNQYKKHLISNLTAIKLAL